MHRPDFASMSRRDFIKTSLSGLAAVPGMRSGFRIPREAAGKTGIAVVKTSDRQAGVGEAMKLLSLPPMKGKRVLVKPNFNTADPFPASTHNDTLSALVREIKARGASGITVGERSGPPPTQKVMEDKGITALAKELGFDILNFEELPDSEWTSIDVPGSHWTEGLSLPRALVASEYVVSTCCLKTHQYGGVFTMSLKLSVGATPKRLMRGLHRSPDQRKMIAEINAGYSPKLIVMDGLEAFVDGGPSDGEKARADVIVAGTNRVAVDAVGVAILKDLGSNDAIMNAKIFDQEQIKRAVELGLGEGSPKQIELLTSDEASRQYAARLRAILDQG